MKNKKSKNKKSFSSYWKILGIVFVVTTIIYISLISIIHLHIYSFPLIKIIIEIINKVLSLFYTVLPVAFGIVATILFSPKNTKMPPLIEWIKNALTKYCVLAFFMVPILVVNGACLPIVDNFEEYYNSEVKKNEELMSDEKKDDVILIIDYNDALFEKYDISYLNDNIYTICEKIVDKLKEPIIEFNKNVDNPKYEKYTQIANDYEMTYNYIRSQDLFNKNPDERLSYPDKIIQNRKLANEHFKTSENQRQISLRYKEAGDDYHNFKKNDEAVMQYLNSIFWSLTALQTSYNEVDIHVSNRYRLIENIVASYKELMSVMDSDEGMQKRCQILIKIFEHIQIQIKESQ